MRALHDISRLLARQRRRNASAVTARAAAFLLALHCLLIAILGFLSVRHPLSPIWLQALVGSYVIFIPLLFLYWAALRAPGNSDAAVAHFLDHANPAAPDPFRTSL